MVVPIGLLAIATALVLVRTEHGLRQAQSAAAAQGQVGFELRKLRRDGDAEARETGFEPVASAASFSAGCFFRGNLYLDGPAGLYVYGPEGGGPDAERPCCIRTEWAWNCQRLRWGRWLWEHSEVRVRRS